MKNKIGLNIRAFRIRENMTQAELAEKINVSRTAVSSWEVGRNEPSFREIENLSLVFKCLKSDLIGAEALECYVISSQDEKNLIDGYRNAAPDIRKFICQLLAYSAAVNGTEVHNE